MPTPSRDEVAALWFLKYWQYYDLRWDRSPPPEEHETTDFADLPEACLVPVRVVYRAVSDEDLRERGEDLGDLEDERTTTAIRLPHP